MLKILKTDTQVFGPYASIEEVDNGYMCDGINVQHTVAVDAVIEEVPDDYVHPKIAMKQLRSQRNKLLAESDIYVLADRWESYTEDQKLAWAGYRQSLRDLPENTVNLANPVWPTKP